MKKLFSAILFMCGLASALTTISIDRPSIFLETERGSAVTHKINLTNRNNTDLKLLVYANDWIYTAKGGKEFLEPGGSQFSCADWLTLEAESIVVPANSTAPFSFTLRTPADAEGGHQAVIFFETDLPGTANIRYGARVGSLIYQKTRKHTEDFLDTLGLKTAKRNGVYTYDIGLRNSGNAWNSAHGFVALVVDGEPLEEVELFTRGLLPDDTVRYNGIFSRRVTGDRNERVEILYMLEDANGALQTGQLLSSDSAQAVAGAKLWVEKFEPTHDKTKNVLQIRCDLAVAETRTIKPAISIYDTATNQRVKIVEFNAKQIKPGKVETLNVSWPIGLPGSIPAGEYICVLTIQSGAETLMEEKIIRIN
ncbi:MAG: hypothetical protein LBL50_05530 [Candidatus Margulisbacteria bacterium]|nr:hypothetical protein [Candidatus Margulisiibacteriota bacterium]